MKPSVPAELSPAVPASGPASGPASDPAPVRGAPRRRQGPDTTRTLLIDGSNVAFEGVPHGAPGKLGQIMLLRDDVERRGFRAIVITDAALRHKIDDPARYERLVDAGIIHQAPAGRQADEFLLGFARELNARIVSNDRFNDWRREFPREAANVATYMIHGMTVILSSPRRGSQRQRGHRQGRH